MYKKQVSMNQSPIDLSNLWRKSYSVEKKNY